MICVRVAETQNPPVVSILNPESTAAVPVGSASPQQRASGPHLPRNPGQETHTRFSQNPPKRKK